MAVFIFQSLAVRKVLETVASKNDNVEEGGLLRLMAISTLLNSVIYPTPTISSRNIFLCFFLVSGQNHLMQSV